MRWDDRLDITRRCVDALSQVFQGIVARGVDRDVAQRFILQQLVAMAAQGAPALRKQADKLGATAVELTSHEQALLQSAEREDFRSVDLAIFGALLQASMDAKERHAFGAHYTSEREILKVVEPTIVRPFRERIEQAREVKELLEIRDALQRFTILDPACGSGNFLYVAYRELRRIEMQIQEKLEAQSFRCEIPSVPRAGLSLQQFQGIDIHPFAVELAKVTLGLAQALALQGPQPIPDLDRSIVCADALFAPWPPSDAIVGNPPFLDARKITMEHGAEYSARIRQAFPNVPGRADLCVYFFRRAHDHLKPGGRAGLVGTNSIRQNYSRQGGLAYIVSGGGTITDAVSTQIWPGEAVVHVSIVNWIKGHAPGPFTLSTQDTAGPQRAFRTIHVSAISSALSDAIDLGSAKKLRCAADPKVVFEGQQAGHIGFVLSDPQKQAIAATDAAWSDVIFPYVNGADLLSGEYVRNPKWLIDFGTRDRVAASKHVCAFDHVKAQVRGDWQNKADKERRDTGQDRGEHQNRTASFWRLKRRRGKLLEALGKLSRYIAVSAVSKRPIFVFLSASIRPSNALKVFALQDDYAFGIVQSSAFWAWLQGKGSSLKGDPRFTPETAFTSFPWPQTATLAQVRAVASIGKKLRRARDTLMPAHGGNLRALHKLAEQLGESPLKDVQRELDEAVRDAYGIPPLRSELEFLLQLNRSIAEQEARGGRPIGPGLPPCVRERDEFVTSDCMT